MSKPMLKVLVTGASGMLGATLVKLWSDKYDIFATGQTNLPQKKEHHYRQFDLTAEDYSMLSKWVTPDIIIHCAAITSHELCEANPEKCLAVNSQSVNKLIKTFPKSKIYFISSDAVFSHNTHLADENTIPAPTTTYGRSKALGEKYTRQYKNGYVIRTTIVGVNINKNNKKISFAEWIVNSVKNNQSINLYVDRLFTPISIWDLAKELEWIIDHDVPRILHVAGSMIISKYDFGHNLCRKLKLNLKLINKTTFDESDQKIKRSADQSLSSSLYVKISGHKLPNLNQTTDSLVKNL